MSSEASEEVFTAPHSFGYTYRRSLGPVLSRFFTGLRDRQIFGIRSRDGRVLVPPTEYDPATGEDLDEVVEVGTSGSVVTWAWVNRPREKQPLDRPFAFALVKLDGADTPLLHVVDAGEESRMETGMRVRVRWSDETQGSIRDIACFEPEEAK